MVTASVGAGSSLLLEPARELLFPLSEVKSVHRPRCILTLTNLSVINDVVFRIRTRNPDAFTVRPTYGLLAPETSIQVVIKATAKSCKRLSAMDPQDLMTRQSSELFLVQSVEREEEVQAMEPLDANSSTLLRAFWQKVPSDCVTENKLICCFVPVTPGTLDVSSNNEMKGRSMSCTSPSAQNLRTSQSDDCNRSKCASEPRLSHSGSNNKLSISKSLVSNQLTLSEKPKEQIQQEVFVCDASFHIPVVSTERRDQRLDMSTSRVATHGNSRTRTSECDSVVTCNSMHNSSVNDTMLSDQTTLSVDTVAKEPRCNLGPLLYHIQPKNTLSFDVTPAPRFWGSTSCFIVNSSVNDCLIFKLRTYNQSGYVVKPSRGLVSPTNAQEVIVSLCAPRHETSFDPKAREANDGFMVEIANISRDQYGDLMRLDERKRFHAISTLWSTIPLGQCQSTILSVTFNMKNRHIGGGICKRFEGGKIDVHSELNRSRTEMTQEQKTKPVFRGSKEMASSSSSEASQCRTADVKGKSKYSNLDESTFTVASNAVPTEVGERYSSGDMTATSASNALREAKVLVVSADRMDIIDFSNPKLSFFV